MPGGLLPAFQVFSLHTFWGSGMRQGLVDHWVAECVKHFDPVSLTVPR